jgi:hypothetical protein
MKAFDGAKPWRNMEVERFSFEGATGPRVAKKGFLNMDNDFTVEEPIIGCLGRKLRGRGISMWEINLEYEPQCGIVQRPLGL